MGIGRPFVLDHLVISELTYYPV